MNPIQKESPHPPSCRCRAHPLHPTMRVGDALHAYLAENGFTVDAYDAPTTRGSVLGFEIAVPNPPAHRQAIKLHDLHHVATGYGTDHAGEAEISVWQARRGLLATGLYVTAIVTGNVLLGLFFAPARTVAAMRSSSPGPSLFGTRIEYETLLDRSVGELRAMLEIPQGGLAELPRELHSHAPASV